MGFQISSVHSALNYTSRVTCLPVSAQLNGNCESDNHITGEMDKTCGCVMCMCVSASVVKLWTVGRGRAAVV